MNRALKKRILFVEDQALLRRMFQSMLSHDHERWEVATAADGEDALALMREQPFDVVVSDMRMPRMSGVELLNEVLRLYPQTSRIIISGVVDQEEVAEALKSTHQFIAKPVDLHQLRATLAQLHGLDAFLKDEKLKALAGRMRTLPSFPVLYLEIMKAIEAPNSSLQVIYDLIIKDPGLTAKILQVVNSAGVGMAQRVNDPLEAVQQLGVNTVRALALSAHVFASFTPSQRLNFPMETLWAYLMKTGRTAQAIMRAEGADHVDVEAAYTAGILHDIGKLMLADGLPGEFQKVLARSATEDVSFSEIEMEVFGASHAGLAAYLLGLWGLPASMVEAVAFHHTPERSTQPEFGPLTAVHVANALEHEIDGEDFYLNMDYLKGIGVAGRLEDWRAEARKSKANGG